MQSLARVFQSFVCGGAPRPPQANDQNGSITLPRNNNNVPLNNEGRPPQVNARQHTRSFLSMVLCHGKNNHANTHNTHNTPVISHIVTTETDQTAQTNEGRPTHVNARQPTRSFLSMMLCHKKKNHADTHNTPVISHIVTPETDQTAKQLPPDTCYEAIQKLDYAEERRAFVADQPQWLSALGLQMKQTTDSTSGASTSTAPVTPQRLSIKAATQLAYVLPYLSNIEQKQQALDILQRSIADILTKESEPRYDFDKLATQLARSAHAMPSELELPLQKHIVRLVRSMRKVTTHNEVHHHVYELPRLRKHTSGPSRTGFTRKSICSVCAASGVRTVRRREKN